MPSLFDVFKPGPLRAITLTPEWIEARERARLKAARKPPTAIPPAATARTMRVKAAAEYLGISEWTLRRHVHNGEIPYLRGKIWRFLVTDLDRFLEQSKETMEVL